MQRDIFEVTWGDFDKTVQMMATYLAASSVQANGIYGEPRGGLCLAVALSHATGLPLLGRPSQGMAWVDDVVETGLTLGNVLTFKPALTMAWFDKSGCDLLNYSSIKADPYDWLVMPWEDTGKAKQDCDEYYAARQ